jgi:hypothetical protein
MGHKSIEDANIEVIVSDAIAKLEEIEEKVNEIKARKKDVILEAAKALEEILPKEMIASELAHALKSKKAKVNRQYVYEVLKGKYKIPEKEIEESSTEPVGNRQNDGEKVIEVTTA